MYPCDHCSEEFPADELGPDGFGYEQVCEECRVYITHRVDLCEDQMRGEEY